MPTTRLHTDGPCTDDEQDVLTLLYAQRGYLPHAENGAPKAPSSPYAASVLKKMKESQIRPVGMLLSVLVTNVRDGVPLPVVRLALRRIEAILAREAGEIRLRPIGPLHLRETTAECGMTRAQLTCDENCPDSLEALLRASAQYDAVQEELVANAEARLVVLRAQRRAHAKRIQRGALTLS